MDVIKRVRELPPLHRPADAKRGSEINARRGYGHSDMVFNGDEVKALLDSLLENQELETLVMERNDNFGSVESCRVLGKIVQTSTTLKHLSLQQVGMDAEGLKLIVEGILNNPQSALEGLDLSSNYLFTSPGEILSTEGGIVGTEQSTHEVVTLESWRALAELVRTSKTLKYLSLEQVGMDAEGLKLIVEGILNNPQPALEGLDLSSNDKLTSPGERLFTEGGIVGTEQSTDEVVSLESWRALGELVRTSKTLKYLSLWDVGLQGKHLKPIVEGILSNSHSALESLNLAGNLLGFDEREFAKQVTDLLLRNIRALTTLDISGVLSPGEMESIGKALASNTTLINLTIGDLWSNIDSLKILWDWLKFNKHLHKVKILSKSFHIGFDIMEFFQVNYTIRELEYYVMDVEKRSQLEGMLMRNQHLGNYINNLQKELQVVKPSIGRLFLCGSPLAGKTTLCTSMVGTQAGRIRKTMSKAKSVLRHNKRTQGIEVRSLKASTGERIALWDMAGQEEYRALHDNHHLFPEMSQACVFLFVFGPRKKIGMCSLNDAELKRLGKELHYWLMFINSNSKKAEVITPRVMIVLTHLDRVYENAHTYVAWAERTIQEMRTLFSGQVEIYNKIQTVNSLSHRDALLVVNEVLTIICTLLPKLREVPAACEKVNITLTKRARIHKAEPIIGAEKFFKICQHQVPELKDLLKIDPTRVPTAEAEKVSQFRRDVLSYLHDSGCIINFEEFQWIVIDINWLGQTFLGKLFNPKDQTMQKMIPSTTDGIVPKRQLKNFLSKFIEDGKYTGVTPEVLVELMKTLKICDDASLLGATTEPQYFMPCTLDDARTGGSKLEWTPMDHDHQGDPVYTGVRLQCKDRTRTFLSPGLFLRYQVHLLKKLSAEGDFKYKIKWNLIHVKHSGVEMFIESSGKFENPQYGGEDDYVDILMKYFDQPMSDKQRKYLYGISELRKFCISREGCPGVVLEEAILRPECVKRLTPCVHRRKQAVSKETLKTKMATHLFAEIGASSGIRNDKIHADSLLDSKIYRQYFEAVHDLKEAEVKATTLLDDWTDIQDAIDKEQKFAVDQVTAIYQVVGEVQKEIKIAVDEVQRESKTPISASSHPSTSSSSSVTDTTSGRLSNKDQTLSESCVDHQNKNVPATVWDFELDRKISKLDRKISFRLERNKDDIISGTKDIIDSTFKDFVKEMRMIQGLLEQQIDMMKNLEQELQQIAVLPRDQTDRMPRFPYFTRYDVNLGKKILALKIVGEASKLHFMCEEPNQPHFVKDQNGYDITTLKQGEWATKLRPLISASVDIFLVFVKAAAHVAAGIGNLIPNISDWQGAIPLTAASLGMETVLNEVKMTNSISVDHELEKKIAWECLLDVIVKPMLQKNEFSKEFSLYQVKYKPNSNNSSTSCYWVCSKCWEKADKADELIKDSSQIEPLGVVQKSDNRYPWC